MKERTFAMIKPSCLGFAREVEEEMKISGLEIVSSSKIRFSREQAAEFYAEHAGKPFFEKLINMITSAPVMVYNLEGYDAIHKWRDLIGPTNPSMGDSSQLRHRFANAEAYAAGSPDNGFHGAANQSEADRDIELMRIWGYFN